MAMGVDKKGPYRRQQSLRHKRFGLLPLSLLLSLLIHGTFWWLSQRQEMAPETLPKPNPLLSLLKGRYLGNLSKRIPTALFLQNRRSRNHLKKRRCRPLKGPSKRSQTSQRKPLRLTHGRRRVPHQAPHRSLQRRPRIKLQGAVPMRALRRMRPIFTTQSLSIPPWRSGDNGKVR